MVELCQALELEPNNIIVLDNRGALRVQVGDFPGAIEDLNRAIELIRGSRRHIFIAARPG